MLLWLLRGLFGILVVGLGASILLEFANSNMLELGIGVFSIFLLVGIATVVVDLCVRHKEVTTISAIYFGLLLGFLLGSLFWAALEPFVVSSDTSTDFNVTADVRETAPKVHKVEAKVIKVGHMTVASQLTRLLIIVVCCYVSVSTLLQTKDEFRFIIPYVEFSKQLKGALPWVLDTSVIIDGRIADICDTRLIDTKLIVPRFVLQELQAIADSSDKLKRNRGRRGLDILKRMQTNGNIDLQVHEANLPELREVAKVDERLVLLAKGLGARVVTNDFNLNKIAQLQGVEVINLNEIANALKSVALPGENLTVRVVKPGDQAGQGVGYLEDGTMVVVEHGKSFVGQQVTLTVTSVLQTPAGRMIFGRVEGRPVPTDESNPEEVGRV